MKLTYHTPITLRLKHMLITLTLTLFCINAWSQTDSTFYVKGAMGRLATRLQLPTLDAGEKCPMVVLCHGFTGNMGGPLFDSIADKLLKAGIGVLRFDFNGHGQSEGDFINMTVPNEIEDVMSIIAATRNLPQTTSISLLGHSQGGVVAAMTAGKLGKDVIKSVVLMAPAAVLRDDALRGNTMGVTYDPWHVPEYVAIKTLRAWTYWQLGLAAGTVSWMEEPVLDLEGALQEHPQKNLDELATLLIDDLTPHIGVRALDYGTVDGLESRKMFIPIDVMLGDLYLYLGRYADAATAYYRYIDWRSLTLGANGNYWDNPNRTVLYNPPSFSTTYAQASSSLI